MKQCYNLNFTNQDCKLFKVAVKEFNDINDYAKNHSIRSLIDPYCSEFEKVSDDEIANGWHNLLLLFSAFKTDGYDLKKEIKANISIQQTRYKNYERDVKMGLAQYIILLRIGKVFDQYANEQLYSNMRVGEMVDLLEKELFIRIKAYRSKDMKYGIIEVIDYLYDYDALYKKFGVNPEVKSGATYDKYIKYIITTEHSNLLKDKRFYKILCG